VASPFTVKNLKELDDSAVEFGLAPNVEARFGRKALEAERSGVSYQRLAPNFKQPFGHKHGEQEETYVIVGGSGSVTAGDETVEIKTWDAVRVAPDTVRTFEAGPDGLELIAFGAGPQGDVEMMQDDAG
jgi:mannose-6-phosphate isomerase-like protein (cupin superfamily)